MSQRNSRRRGGRQASPSASVASSVATRNSILERMMEDDRRRYEENHRRRDEENRRRDEENHRRRDEENRRRDEENRRRDEQFAALMQGLVPQQAPPVPVAAVQSMTNTSILTTIDGQSDQVAIMQHADADLRRKVKTLEKECASLSDELNVTRTRYNQEMRAHWLAEKAMYGKLNEEKCARQMAELLSQEKERQISMLSMDYRQIQQRLRKLEGEHRQEREKVTTLNAQVDQAQQKRAALQTELGQQTSEVTQLRAREHKLTQEVVQLGDAKRLIDEEVHRLKTARSVDDLQMKELQKQLEAEQYSSTLYKTQARKELEERCRTIQELEEENTSLAHQLQLALVRANEEALARSIAEETVANLEKVKSFNDVCEDPPTQPVIDGNVFEDHLSEGKQCQREIRNGNVFEAKRLKSLEVEETSFLQQTETVKSALYSVDSWQSSDKRIVIDDDGLVLTGPVASQCVTNDPATEAKCENLASKKTRLFEENESVNEKRRRCLDQVKEEAARNLQEKGAAQESNAQEAAARRSEEAVAKETQEAAAAKNTEEAAVQMRESGSTTKKWKPASGNGEKTSAAVEEVPKNKKRKVTIENSTPFGLSDAKARSTKKVRKKRKSTGWKSLVALVLPFHPCVEISRLDHQPTEWLSIQGNTFEEQASSAIPDVFEKSGFVMERWSRVPYLCDGDMNQAFYWLDDAVFVLKVDHRQTPIDHEQIQVTDLAGRDGVLLTSRLMFSY